MVRAVPRGYTVCADAYLTPKIHQYLKGFTSGFKGGLKVCFLAPLCVFFFVFVLKQNTTFSLVKCLVYRGINQITHSLHPTDHRQSVPDVPVAACEFKTLFRLNIEMISSISSFPLSSGCGCPVHAVRWRSDSHGAVLRFTGRSVWSSRRCGGIRHHLLQPDGEKTCDWL